MYFSKISLKNAVSSLSFLGGTSNLAAGLNQARTNQFTSANGDRTGVQNIVIFITDGFDSSDSQPNAISEAAQAKAAGIIIFGVGIGRAADAEDSYRKIASLPQQLKQSYYPTSSYSSLNSTLIDALVARTCVSSAHIDCSRKVGLQNASPPRYFVIFRKF